MLLLETPQQPIPPKEKLNKTFLFIPQTQGWIHVLLRILHLRTTKSPDIPCHSPRVEEVETTLRGVLPGVHFALSRISPP